MQNLVLLCMFNIFDFYLGNLLYILITSHSILHKALEYWHCLNKVQISVRVIGWFNIYIGCDKRDPRFDSNAANE